MNLIKKRNRMLTYKLLSILASTILIFSACKTEVDQSDTTPPGEVKNISITAGDKCLSLSWTNPGDSDFTSTQITFTPEEDGIAQPIVIKGEANKTSATKIEGLKNDTEYTIIFITIDNNGNESNGIERAATPIDNAPPGEVKNISITAGDKCLSLSWTNPSDGDFASTQITFTPEEDGIVQPIVIKGEANKTSATKIEGLKNDTEYTIIFITIDNNGNESNGIERAATPIDNAPPGEVSDLVITPHHEKITLTWTNPSDADFYGVEITFLPSEETIIQPILIEGNPSEEETYTIENLQGEKDYELTIKTIDKKNNKSEGIKKSSNTKESTLSLTVTLPNDDGDNITLTNDNTPVIVNISSTESIIKAVWKKNENTDSPNANNLLDDETANELSLDSLSADSNKLTFTVSENGFYDIAVKNAEDIAVCIQTEIKTIDKTPLAEVETVETSCDGEYVHISWKDSANIDKYDSPLKNIKISYVYNDDESDPDNGELTIDAGVEKAAIKIAEGKSEYDFMRLSIQSLDELGNMSDGILCISYCTKSIIVNKTNAIDKISSLTENTKVFVLDEYSTELMENLKTALKTDDSVKIDLDMSKVKNMTLIEKEAFKSCKKLLSIIIPDTVRSIEEDAFYNCKNLNSINLHNNLTSIGISAFRYCNNLTSITIPDSITYISDYAFAFGENPKNITIPASVLKIGSSPFSSSEEEVNIYYTGTVEQWCSINLEHNNWGGGIGLNYNLYINGQKQTNITIPDNVKTINDYAFHGCNSLTSVTIPEHVESIGTNAFSHCKNLKKVTIPGSNCLFGEDAFLNYTDGHQTIEDIIIYGNSISFQFCKVFGGLSKISLPTGLTHIGENAFANCEFTSITIPDSVTHIGENAFARCGNLSSIIISEGIQSIGDYAFSYCDRLKSMNIPKSIEYFGKQYCYLESLNYMGTIEQWCGIKKGDIISTYDLDLYISGVKQTDVIIPDSVTNINDYSFADCTSITSITIPSSVKKIGKYAFRNCQNLTSVTMPGSWSYSGIDETSFYNCENFKEITFTSNISGSFYVVLNETPSITSIIISDGVTDIFSGFENCEYITDIIIPDSVKYIGMMSFRNCTNLTNINITGRWKAKEYSHGVPGEWQLDSSDFSKRLTSDYVQQYNWTRM